MTTRRKLLLAIATVALCSPLPVLAQPVTKVPRIGIVEREPSFPYLEAFRQGMRERGYVEGKNIVK